MASNKEQAERIFDECDKMMTTMCKYYLKDWQHLCSGSTKEYKLVKRCIKTWKASKDYFISQAEQMDQQMEMLTKISEKLDKLQNDLDRLNR